MYSRTDDDILPAPARRGARRDRPRASRPPEPLRPARPEAAPRPAAERQRRIRATTVVFEVALTLAALLGVAVTGVTLVAARTGLRPLVVRSGSMEPTIATGSMVLMRPVDAADISVGDVVAVERPDHTRVTHRVVKIERHGETAELTLKGDANEDPDPVPVTVRRAERLVRQVPQIGRAAAELATPRGGFAIGCVLTAVAMHVLRRRGGRSAPVSAHA